MRTSPTPLVARPAWYDRNPASKVFYSSFSASPHSLTERFSYTCPSGKKALVEVLSARVERVTAATEADTAVAVFKFTPSGATGYYILRSSIRTNNAGDKEDKAIGTTLVMCPGDKIQAFTFDLSTGGTCSYLLTMKITEFDA